MSAQQFVANGIAASRLPSAHEVAQRRALKDLRREARQARRTARRTAR